MVETGQFATLWKTMAEKLGLKPEFIKTDWRIGADPAAIEEHLRKDKNKEIKAVCVLHNETSTGCLSDRRDPQGDRRRRPSGAVLRRHHLLARLDRLPPRRVGRRRHRRRRPEGADAAARDVVQRVERQGAGGFERKLTKSFWAWDDMLNMNKIGFFPYTPARCCGLAAGIDMLHEEGLDNVFARHHRLAEATRRAVRAWGSRSCAG